MSPWINSKQFKYDKEMKRWVYINKQHDFALLILEGAIYMPPHYKL